MVGTKNRNTKKNSLFVCFAVLEVNQLFYHEKYLDEHILSFSNFRSKISFSNCPYFLFSLSPRLSQFICLEFLFPSPFSIRKQDHQIIYSNVLSLSLSLLIPFRKRAIFERMRGGAGSKFQHYVNHAPHFSFDLRPSFLLLSYFSTFSSLSFCIC